MDVLAIRILPPIAPGASETAIVGPFFDDPPYTPDGAPVPGAKTGEQKCRQWIAAQPPLRRGGKVIRAVWRVCFVGMTTAPGLGWVIVPDDPKRYGK